MTTTQQPLSPMSTATPLAQGMDRIEAEARRTGRTTGAAPIGASQVAGGAFAIVDLSTHFNNDGISHASPVSDGDLNGEGMAFPRQVLPPSNQIVELAGIPFLFPDKETGADNNVSLEGQVVDVPPGNYNRLHVLGVSEGGSFEEPLELRYGDGTTGRQRLGLTDCRPMWGKVRFGEQGAVRFPDMHFPPGDYHCCDVGDICGLWLQTLAVDARRELVSVELGDNASMHIFALSLCRAADGCPNDTWLSAEERLTAEDRR